MCAWMHGCAWDVRGCMDLQLLCVCKWMLAEMCGDLIVGWSTFYGHLITTFLNKSNGSCSDPDTPSGHSAEPFFHSMSDYEIGYLPFL